MTAGLFGFDGRSTPAFGISAVIDRRYNEG
jgi:hypothetical protein